MSPNPLWKRFNQGKKKPPFYPSLSWYTKKRIASDVIDEISKKSIKNPDPSTDIINLSKYTDRGSAVIGSLEYETITFTTVDGTEIYYIIDNAEKLDNIRNGLGLNYILARDIDLIDTATQNETTSSGDYDADAFYFPAEIVTYKGNRYKSLAESIGATPDSSPDYWRLYNYNGWNLIGTSSNPFTGVFNGNGFKISNMFIDRTNDVGFFGRIEGAKISNIGIVDCNVTGNDNVGGLVGVNRTSSIVINSYSTGSVTGGDYVGGLVGVNRTSSIVINSYSTGSVTGGWDVGGLVGQNYEASITNSYSTCNATGYSDIGGLVGSNLISSTITNSYSTGNATGNRDIGGLVGGNYNSSTVTNSYFDKDVVVVTIEGVESEGEYYSETGRTTEQLQNIDNIETGLLISEIWDFVNIWGITPDNIGYPYLRAFESGDKNAKLIFDPATEIIDLEKYKPYTVVDGWNTVTFKTIDGDKVYRVISTFEDLDRIRDGLSSNYILANNIDAIDTHTQNPTTANKEDYDDTSDYLENDIVNYNGDRYKCIQDFTQGVGDNYIDITNEDYWKENNYEGWRVVHGFTGILNGNGFEIRSLKFNRPTNNQSGLFTAINGATIANLGMRDAVIIGKTVNPSNPYHGVLAGLNNTSSTITNCYSTNCTVMGNERVGGLVGFSRSSSIITNCYSTNCTVMGHTNVGGLVGYNYDSSTITNCYSTNCTVTGNDRVGGLVGYNYNSSIITNCYYIGRRPSATNTAYLSLLVGLNSTSTITNSYACETDEDGNDVDDPMQFTNTTTGVTGSGNRTTTDMRTQATYIDWDFTNIWGIDATINNGYPYLRVFEAGYSNWLSNYKIVGIPPADIDGYIKFPTGVMIEVAGVSYDIFNKMSPIYNEDDGVTPNPTGSTYYLGDETTVYVDEENYLWHINELNTETILSYLKPAYKFSWFVKNTFETGTYTPTSVKEILAYDTPITDTDDLNKIKRYIKYDWEA